MALNSLDPAAALLIVSAREAALEPAGRNVARRIGALAEGMRVRGSYVLFASRSGRPATTPIDVDDLDSALLQLSLGVTPQRGEEVVLPSRGSAFSGTHLHHRLQMLGVGQLLLAGMPTASGVESTARDAYDLGYDVVVVADAVHDSDRLGHDFALAWSFPSLGTVCTTADVLAAVG